GKSAIVPIIDYCLGSGKCTIPVGIIRNLTEWYGVLVQSGSRQFLLARPDPGTQDQTGDMYFDESKTVSIVAQPTKNTNTDGFVERFNDLAGLPKIHFAPEAENPGFHGRPSFRDMAAFNFQPQYLVANPYTLFFKADTFEHREKLKVIFPLVLGVVSSRDLQLREELAGLKDRLNELLRKQEAITAANASWLGEVQAFYAVVKELGLLNEVPESQPEWSAETYIRHLRGVPQALKSSQIPTIEAGATAQAVATLLELRREDE